MLNQTSSKEPSKYGTTFKSVVITLAIGAVLAGLYYMGLLPMLSSQESKTLVKSTLTNETVNDKTKTAMLPVLSINQLEFADVSERHTIKGQIWTWAGNFPMMAANGGPITMKNSLMDQRGISLELITNNSVSDMKIKQMAFVNDYAKNGIEYPSNGVAFVTIMGDGAVSYISEMNKNIKKAYGAEYQLTIIGIFGFSLGEDCIMGPEEWKTNPQSMRGCVISAVNGDGDHLVGIRWASDNGVPINPDQGTYDENAVNFVEPPESDFLRAAEQVIAGATVELKVKDSKGRLSGATVTKVIQGAGTWFPGDRNMVNNLNTSKVASTVQYPNQMACVVVGCKKWFRSHQQWTVDFLSASLTAGNQIKQHNEWFNFACDIAPRVFCAASPEDCSETAADWKRFAIPKGGKLANTQNVEVSVGGTLMANLTDNRKYFGMNKSKNSYYKSVYDWVSNVLTTLNPADFMGNVGEITPYEEMVDTLFISKVNVESTPSKRTDYSKPVEDTKSEKSWNIIFASGKSIITSAGEETLEDLFNEINISENSTVEIIGHTDDLGTDDGNLKLSKERAQVVKDWLVARSNNTFPPERFRVEGKGYTAPLIREKTETARKKNRRVDIVLRTLK